MGDPFSNHRLPTSVQFCLRRVASHLQVVFHGVKGEHFGNFTSDFGFRNLGRSRDLDSHRRAVDFVFGHFQFYGFCECAQFLKFVFIDPFDRIPTQRRFEDFSHRREGHLVDNENLVGNGCSLTDCLSQSIENLLLGEIMPC